MYSQRGHWKGCSGHLGGVNEWLRGSKYAVRSLKSTLDLMQKISKHPLLFLNDSECDQPQIFPKRSQKF